MEYAVGFIVGIGVCFLATCLKKQYYTTSSRGITYVSYDCGNKRARYRDSGGSPLRVWVKVYQPEPIPHPGNDPVAAGAVAATKNMGNWEATSNSWPSGGGDVFLFAWFEQTAGTINKIGPSSQACTGGMSPPVPPVPPTPPTPPIPPVPPVPPTPPAPPTPPFSQGGQYKS